MAAEKPRELQMQSSAKWLGCVLRMWPQAREMCRSAVQESGAQMGLLRARAERRAAVNAIGNFIVGLWDEGGREGDAVRGQ